MAAVVKTKASTVAPPRLIDSRRTGQASMQRMECSVSELQRESSPLPGLQPVIYITYNYEKGRTTVHGYCKRHAPFKRLALDSEDFGPSSGRSARGRDGASNGAVNGVGIMEFSKQYYWVVLCKNHLFHNRQNRSSGHQILLGETDEVLSPPRLGVPFKVKCDDCDKEYSYLPSEVLRSEAEPPPFFVAHPLFTDSDGL